MAQQLTSRVPGKGLDQRQATHGNDVKGDKRLCMRQPLAIQQGAIVQTQWDLHLDQRHVPCPVYQHLERFCRSVQGSEEEKSPSAVGFWGPLIVLLIREETIGKSFLG